MAVHGKCELKVRLLSSFSFSASLFESQLSLVVLRAGPCRVRRSTWCRRRARKVEEGGRGGRSWRSGSVEHDEPRAHDELYIRCVALILSSS